MRFLNNVQAETVPKIQRLNPNLVSGDPQPTNGYTAEQLKADRIVGIYSRRGNEIDEKRTS